MATTKPKESKNAPERCHFGGAWCGPATEKSKEGFALCLNCYSDRVCPGCKAYGARMYETWEGEMLCLHCAASSGQELCVACEVLWRSADLINDRCEDCQPRCCDCDNLLNGEHGDRCSDCQADYEDEHGRSFTFRQADGESTATPLPYLGWELEVECAGSWDDTTDSVWRKARTDWLHRHYDGSLRCGIEFVSDPMTLAWIKQHREPIAKFLSTLQSNGCKSYKTETCGMHVHVSRNAFIGDHLYRFMHFFYSNPEFIHVVSRRSQELLDRWASLTSEKRRAELQTPFGTAEKPKWLKDKADTNGRNQVGKYVAVNLRQPSTAEVRIFKGTLSAKGFFCNLEFVDAAFHFTKEADDRTANKFVAWVKSKAATYPNLAEFLTSNKKRIGKCVPCEVA